MVWGHLKRASMRISGKKLTTEPVEPIIALQGQTDLLHHHMAQYQQHINQWLNYLHSHIHHLHSKHDKLHHSHKSHKLITRNFEDSLEHNKKHLSKLTDYHEKHHRSVSTLQSELKDIRSSMHETLGGYNSHIISLHKIVAELQQQVKTMSEQQIQAPQPVIERPVEHKESHKDVKIRHHHNESEHKPETKKKVSSEPSKKVQFTAAEKTLVALLIATEKQFSYRDLAAELKKSPSTIKTQLNNLRHKGLNIGEMTDSEGVKRFYLTDTVKAQFR